jgi:hypothetical protein
MEVGGKTAQDMIVELIATVEGCPVRGTLMNPILITILTTIIHITIINYMHIIDLGALAMGSQVQTEIEC